MASAKAVEDTLAQLTQLLGTPVGRSPLVAAAQEDANFRKQLEQLVEREIYPAFARYRDCIRDEIRPHARDDRHPGVCFVEGGGPFYRLCIRRETSLDLAPGEIHTYGLTEIARIRDEIRELGQRLYGTSELPAIRARLEQDPAQHPAGAEALLDKARATLARAEQALPRLFGTLPQARCEVVPIPAHEAPFSTLAYYRPGTQDGSRPGPLLRQHLRAGDAPPVRSRGALLPRVRARPPPADRAGAGEPLRCRSCAATSSRTPSSRAGRCTASAWRTSSSSTAATVTAWAC